jgi:hypothetical protein
MVPYPFVRPAALITMDRGNAGFAGAKTCPTMPRGQALAIVKTKRQFTAEAQRSQSKRALKSCKIKKYSSVRYSLVVNV